MCCYTVKLQYNGRNKHTSQFGPNTVSINFKCDSCSVAVTCHFSFFATANDLTHNVLGFFLKSSFKLVGGVNHMFVIGT